MNELAKTNQGNSLMTMQLTETMEIGKVFAESGMFDDIKSQAQAVVKIIAGRELGIPPITAMSKVFMISGKIAIPGEIMGDLIKRSGKYDYRVNHKTWTAENCEITFYEITNGKREEIGVSIFTMEEANKILIYSAGGQTKPLTSKVIWKNYPKNMLCWRALANGARIYCPDAIHGAYTTDEVNFVDTTVKEVNNIDDKIAAAQQSAQKKAINAEITPPAGNEAETAHAPAERTASPIADLKTGNSPASFTKQKELTEICKGLPGDSEERAVVFSLLKTQLRLEKIENDALTTKQVNDLIEIVKKNQSTDYQPDDEFDTVKLEKESAPEAPAALEAPAETPLPANPGHCVDCGKKVGKATAALSVKKHKAELCAVCMKARK